MTHPALAPRALTAADLPGLLAVQQACYGEALVESSALFARRLASPANCSLVLEQAGRVCAYLAAYVAQRGKVTPLHGDFEASPHADTLYLHDLAVRPDCSGQGQGQALLQTLWAHAAARGLRRSALVSVQDSQAFWERLGYTPQPLDSPQQRSRLASYGDGALYMVRALP